MGDEVLPWRFIEAGTITVSNEYPEDDTPAEAQYLAISNRYGFTAIYTWKSHLLFAKTARLFDLAKTKVDLLETPSADVFQAPVKGFVKGLYLSGDELVLALAKRRSVLFFSAKALEHKDPTPLGKVRICASKEESVAQLSWHPAIPNLLLALSSKGKVTLIDSATKRSYDWGAGLPSDIISLTWSSSGKSVLCGGKSGDVLWVNKDGTLRAKFPKPDTAFSGEEFEAHQVVTVSARTIGVAYRPVENPGDSVFYLIDLPKEPSGEAKMTQVNYLGMPNPQRTSLYHFGQVKDWKLLMVGGSNFAEIEVVSTESTGSTDGDEPLDPLSLNDSFRAQVPMRAQGDDNHLLGLAFDFTKSDSMPDPTNPDRTPFAPSPILFLLIDEGKLIAYVFVKTNLPKDETLKLPFMIQPAPIPATQTLVPLTEKPDLVPSVALAAGPTDGAGGPLSPSSQRNSLRQASHGLGTATKPTTSTTSTPVPAAGGSASFSFGAPPGAGTSAFSFSASAPAATTKPEETATKPPVFSFGAPSGPATAPAGAALPAFSFEPAKPAAEAPGAGASTFSLGTSAPSATKKPSAFSFAPSGSAKASAGAAPPAFSFEPAKPTADMPGTGASTFSFAPAATKKPEEATTKPPSFSFGASGSATASGAAPPAFSFEPAKPIADVPKPSPLGLGGKQAPAPSFSFTQGDAPSSDAPPAKRRQPTAEPSKPISFQPPAAATPTSRAATATAAGPKLTMPAPTMTERKITAPTPDVAPKITTPAPAPVAAAEPKPREPVARRPVVGEGGDARDLQNQFIEHIASFEQVLDEVRAAERETARLMHKIENGPATPGEFTQAGLVRLRKRTDQLVDDINAITEQNLQQQRTRKQVHDDYMEAVGLYTDADSLFHAKTDKQYQLLLNNRKLDAESAAMRKNIQKLSADVETKMAEVETHLQRMWNVQRRKEKKAMRVPVGDTLYRTLKSYDEIAQRQAIQLQDLSEEFEKLRMQSEYASTLSLGLAVSPSRTASPAGKSPFAREQRRRLSVLDRERNSEDEDGTPHRVRDSGLAQTPNGKEYTERMKELKKIIAQRVRNTPRRRPAEKKQPVAGSRYPEDHQSWQHSQGSRMAGTPTTPSSASSSLVGAAPVRADKPAPPQFGGGGNGEKNAAASAAKPLGRWDQPPAASSPPAAAASFSFAPSTAGSAAPASSFSFGASLTAGDKSKAAKPLGRKDQPPTTPSTPVSFSFAPSTADGATPASSFSFAPSTAGSAAPASSFSFGASLTTGDKSKAGAPLMAATTSDKGATASASGFGGGSFSLPSFNVPETKPISVSSPTTPPQRLVPVNLVAGYSRSESDEEGNEEDDEEGPYDEEESDEGEDDDDDDNEDEYPDEDEDEDEEDEYPDLGPASGPKLGTLPAPAPTKPSGADTLFDFKPLPNPLASVTADVRPPGEFSFGPSVAPITSGTTKSKPATASGTVDAEPASSGPTLGVGGTPKQLAKSPVAKSLFSSADDTPATFSLAAPSASSLSSATTASTSSAETSTPSTSSSSAPAFSFSSAPAAAASSAAAAPSFTFPSTTTATAPEKPAASTAASTTPAPAAASTPATGSTATSAPAPFGAFSFASGGDKPATSGLASTAPAAASSGSALGSFSFSSAPAGTTSAAAPATTAASPFGSFSFASTPAAGGAAPAAAAPAAAAAPTGASPFGSFSFSSTPTASAPAAGTGASPFGAASASAPASTGSLFGGLSLGSSQPASSPAANPFGSGLSATPGAASTSSPFGAPAASSGASAASPFGAPASTPASGGMSLFGATSSLPTLASSSRSTPTFGSTSAFGTPAAATSSPFGAASSAAPAFGAPAFGQPAFGAPSPLSGSAGGGFGTPAFGSVSAFGSSTPAASAAPAGGQQRTFGSGFGSAASGTGGGGFASFASGTGGGGFASLASGTSGGGGFGAAAGTGGGGFASLASGTSGFGGASAGTGGGGFSSLLPSTSASPFGAAPAGDVWGAIRK